jgi:hypothetical protein
MNPQLDYLIATQRAADLRRAAEQARLVQDERVIESTGGRGGLTARTIVRLRLRGAKSARLRVRRA